MTRTIAGIEDVVEAGARTGKDMQNRQQVGPVRRLGVSGVSRKKGLASLRRRIPYDRDLGLQMWQLQHWWAHEATNLNLLPLDRHQLVISGKVQISRTERILYHKSQIHLNWVTACYLYLHLPRHNIGEFGRLRLHQLARRAGHRHLLWQRFLPLQVGKQTQVHLYPHRPHQHPLGRGRNSR